MYKAHRDKWILPCPSLSPERSTNAPSPCPDSVSVHKKAAGITTERGLGVRIPLAEVYTLLLEVKSSFGQAKHSSVVTTTPGSGIVHTTMHNILLDCHSDRQPSNHVSELSHHMAIFTQGAPKPCCCLCRYGPSPIATQGERPAPMGMVPM